MLPQQKEHLSNVICFLSQRTELLFGTLVQCIQRLNSTNVHSMEHILQQHRVSFNHYLLSVIFPSHVDRVVITLLMESARLMPFSLL